MNNLYRLLMRPFFYEIFIWMLNRVPLAIPVKRLQEIDLQLAFFRPKPDSPFHVIFLPNKPIRSFSDLKPADPFLVNLVVTMLSLVSENNRSAYRLINNSGGFQEFPHLQFHLISNAGAQGIATK